MRWMILTVGRCSLHISFIRAVIDDLVSYDCGLPGLPKVKVGFPVW